jgi:general secretion pathway protein G
MVKTRIVVILIPLSIVVIAISTAFGLFPAYGTSVREAKEAVVAADCRIIQRAVASYTEDQNHPPVSLDDLVTAGYLKAVPIDPRTHERWNEW